MVTLKTQNEMFTNELADLKAMIIPDRKKILVGSIEQSKNKK